jgi:hypothetical protein
VTVDLIHDDNDKDDNDDDDNDDDIHHDIIIILSGPDKLFHLLTLCDVGIVPNWLNAPGEMIFYMRRFYATATHNVTIDVIHFTSMNI